MPDYAEIIYEVDGPVATITLNRPDTLNALTDLTQAEVRHALESSERNGEVIGTVITGAGRGFCSGVDMNALGAMSEAGKRLGNAHDELAADPGNPDDDPNYKSSPTYFLGLRKPLIAAINGACAGLGFSWATFCDLRFVDRSAKFVTSFSPRGLIAEHGTSWMLPRLIGPSNALDLFWSSRKFDGEEAFRLGYANRLCEDGECVADAQNYLREIAGTGAPNSIMMMKRQVYKHLNRELGPAMAESTVWMDESLARDDFKEGVASFVERRPPKFAPIDLD
ncbi:MAG: enoyl-CoA hydratase [Gammaproteobacteria bacterium]|nr:enoyl-CoA hydratase [Gammaproteobacteria bacterium]|tara:strand:+ start:193 stop:1032 length:840 start_codon:yes stop_codon:yes gene_type:complete